MSPLNLAFAFDAPPDFQTQPNLELPARQTGSGIVKRTPELLNREFAAISATYSQGQENFEIAPRSETRKNPKEERSYGIVMKVESYLAELKQPIPAGHKAATAAA